MAQQLSVLLGVSHGFYGYRDYGLNLVAYVLFADSITLTNTQHVSDALTGNGYWLNEEDAILFRGHSF